MSTIVLVVRDAASPTPGDTILQDRLELAGHAVVRRSDEDVEYTGTYDGVVVSDSSSGATFGAKYDTVTKPGITCENATWRLGSYVGATDTTQWVVNSVPGADGGLSGTQTVYNTIIQQQGIDVGSVAGGQVVATQAGDAGKGVYVIYEAGAALTSGTAPARRVFLRTIDVSIPELTAEGTALLDAAIGWAFGSSGPPTVDAGTDVGAHVVNTVFTRTATEVGTDITSRAWTILSGPDGVGSTLSTSATLTWTPTVTGDYVLEYAATNTAGTGTDTVAVTVVPGGTGDAPSTSVLQSAFGLAQGVQTATATLPATPDPAHLVLAVFSGNKDAGTITLPGGATSRSRYIGPSVSGDVAESTGLASGTWSWTGNVGGLVALLETDVTDWAFRSDTTVPNPVADTAVDTLSADLGAAPLPGVVYAIVNVDSSWGSGGPFAPGPPTWTNGYIHVGVFQEAVSSAGDAGGAAFAIAKKDVASGESTATTVSWTGGADQACLHLVEFDVATAAGEPRLNVTLPMPQVALAANVDAGPGTVSRAPRLGIDKIALRLSGGSGPVRIDFSTSADLANPISSPEVNPTALGDAHVPIPAGLTPGVAYHFRPRRNGSYIGSVRQFTTLPGPSQTSFAFAFGSCRQHLDDAPVLGQALDRGAQMFAHLGDADYRDINSTDPGLYRDADDEQYDRPQLSRGLTEVPGLYVWSDHDFCGDSSTGSSLGRETRQQVYRERVPSLDLPSASGGIYHSFTTWGGRIRFIVLDTRSYRDSIGTTADGTMLGSEQLLWLENELAAVTEPLTFICSAEGWHSSGSDDDWGFFQNERAQIAGWITAADTECVFLCGDMHKAAIGLPEDGTPGGVHVWHAGGLRQFNNGTKGGPYSFEATYYDGIVGLVELTDTGGQVEATFRVLRDGTTDWSATDTVTVDTGTMGALAVELPMPTSVLAADVRATGDLAASLPSPSAALSADVAASGGLDVALPLPVGALTGKVTTTGALAAGLPMPVVAIGGAGEAAGGLAVTLPRPTVALTADVHIPAVLAATLPGPQAELAAAVAVPAALAVTLPRPGVTISAGARVAGALAVVLPLPAAEISDERKNLHGPTLRAGIPVVVRGLSGGTPTVTRGPRADPPTTA